ncbi:serine-rich adhesin for platelets [Aplysia californica]|uniref:Serine-rich adhesin for platelets n=1 Tax=Aplysia californica TaxID=6500 RepID=A0ABM0JJF1_APLCA|nr:serine-rich adhesin for platelets [Aplysia californica]
MEVDCSLDEFAQVFAVNGYINDDSCFGDADLPSMLSALDSASVLDSPESFPDSPCSDDDLSRVLELAQLPSPSLLQTCLPDNFTSTKASLHCNTNNNNSHISNLITTNNNINSNDNGRCGLIGHQQANMMRMIPTGRNVSKSRDPCIANAVLGHTLDSLSLTLRSGIENAHKELRLDKSIIEDSDPFSMSSIFDAKDVLNNNCFAPDNLTVGNGGSRVEDHHGINLISSSTSHHLQRSDNGGCDIFTNATSPLEHHAPEFLASSADVVAASPNDVQGGELKPVDPPKQKRKRKSKGYSKPAKSRRKKLKTSPEPSPSPTTSKKSTESKSKAKSQKSCQASAPHTQLSQKTGVLRLPTEDSGFESAEKDPQSDSNSNSSATTITCSNSGADDNNYNTSPRSLSSSGGSPTADPVSTSSPDGETRTLRRSTRSTRNTENYNLRLSSLVKRVETERRQQEPKQPKGKVKPAPLSKYRRRTANARERDRMKEINEAFDNLKDSLPDVGRDDGKNKITKFTILKLALNYIANLRDMLGYGDLGPAFTDGEDVASPETTSSFLSVCPTSVTSLAGEDSCSSLISGQSELDHHQPVTDHTTVNTSLASPSTLIASTSSPPSSSSSTASSSSSSSSSLSPALLRSLSLPANIAVIRGDHKTTLMNFDP